MRICILRKAGLLKFLFFCGFSFSLLSLNFYTNFLGSAEQSWFVSFDQSSERCMMGRLVKSKQDGIFSSGGLLIYGVTDKADLKDPLWFFNDKFDNYDAYLNNKRIDYFVPPYYSQICGQGIFFSILDKIIPYSPPVKLRIFRAISCALTALVITAIIGWFYLEFGFATGLTVLAFGLISQWLTVFPRNLWWSIWAFYLPMAMVMLYFQCMSKKRQVQNFKLECIVFFTILIKTIFNGYEFITTTLIMMTVPFIYYSVLNKEGFAAVCAGFMKMALSAGLAIAVSMCILSFQIASVSGNFLEGFDHLIYTLQKRTHTSLATTNNQFLPANIEGMQAPVMSVVRTYLHQGFCSIDSQVFTSNSEAPRFRYYVSYARLILFFSVMTLILYVSVKRYAVRLKDRGPYALIIATWFSILAPLSWFVVFKAHSYSHPQLNAIVWQMPFTFFGAAITGLAVRCSISWLWVSIRGTRPTG